MKQGKQISPIRNKDGDYVMLILCRKSEGCIYSFNLSRENIIHTCRLSGSIHPSLDSGTR